MPSYYRGIDDDSHLLWRIQVENNSRPSKKQRRSGTTSTSASLTTSLTTSLTADNNNHDEEDMESSASFASSSSSDNDNADDNKNTMNMNMGMSMATESDHDESVESILHDYITSNISNSTSNSNSIGNDETELLLKGLDKLLVLVGGAANANTNTKQHGHKNMDMDMHKNKHRLEMLNAGGHWMLTSLLATFTAQRGQSQAQAQGGVHELVEHENYNCNHRQHKDCHSYDDIDIDSNNSCGIDTSTKTMKYDNDDDLHRQHDERVVAIVIRSCQILRELLCVDPNYYYYCEEAEANTGNYTHGHAHAHAHATAAPVASAAANNCTSATVRYQIYCAGGLDAVVEALQKFPLNFGVQMAGCQFLSRLMASVDDNDLGNNGSMDGIDNMDGIENSNSNPSVTLINDLYRSTDGLKIVLRLLVVFSGTATTTGAAAYEYSDGSGVAGARGRNRNAPVGDSDLWRLYFEVTNIIRGVVAAVAVGVDEDASAATCTTSTAAVYRSSLSSLDMMICNSNTVHRRRRLEIIRTLREIFLVGSTSGSSNDDSMMAIDGDSGHLGGNNPGRVKVKVNVGLEKHMYDYLMTILVEE